MNLASIIANVANLAFLLLIFIFLLNFIIKNKIVQLILMLFFAGFVFFVKCYHDMTLINLTRGVMSDLSISGLLFLVFLAIIYFARLPIHLFDRTFCLIIVTIGMILYLSVLDILPLDVYRLGYLPNSFLVVVFLLCILFLLLNNLFALIWLTALIMFLFKLQNSVNLWDYLIDPVLWLVCLYKLIFNKKHVVKKHSS